MSTEVFLAEHYELRATMLLKFEHHHFSGILNVNE